jgi:hypothetical protein
MALRAVFVLKALPYKRQVKLYNPGTRPQALNNSLEKHAVHVLSSYRRNRMYYLAGPKNQGVTSD